MPGCAITWSPLPSNEPVSLFDRTPFLRPDLRYRNRRRAPPRSRLAAGHRRSRRAAVLTAASTAPCSFGSGRDLTTPAQHSCWYPRRLTDRDCFAALAMTNRSAALFDRDVVALRGAGEQLTRTHQLGVGIGDHLGPLCNPADRTRDREQNSEHRGREPHRLQDDARVEVDIRVQPAANEIIVIERNLFELHRQIEQWVVLDAQLVEHLVTAVAEHTSARIVVFIHSMTEAVLNFVLVLVLHMTDKFGNILLIADARQHLQHRLIGAAMRGAPQRRDAGGDAGEWVGAARPRIAHRRGRGIL